VADVVERDVQFSLSTLSMCSIVIFGVASRAGRSVGGLWET